MRIRRDKSAAGVSGLTPTTEDLSAINLHTLRELKEDEVFVFSLTLCDNRVDRDGERFPLPALHRLAELFVGKTGIFDHQPRASNQMARIYHTGVLEHPGEYAAEGEAYAELTARAYMLRDESTMATVRSIEAGILKEVSIGCAVGRITCSVCGADQRQSPCAHRRGLPPSAGGAHRRL